MKASYGLSHGACECALFAAEELVRGKVVLVNFWTYSCINSLRELPYMKDWAAQYKDAGLVVIGAHAPEFGFEKDPSNVKNGMVARPRCRVLDRRQINCELGGEFD